MYCKHNSTSCMAVCWTKLVVFSSGCAQVKRCPEGRIQPTQWFHPVAAFSPERNANSSRWSKCFFLGPTCGQFCWVIECKQSWAGDISLLLCIQNLWVEIGLGSLPLWVWWRPTNASALHHSWAGLYKHGKWHHDMQSSWFLFIIPQLSLKPQPFWVIVTQKQ